MGDEVVGAAVEVVGSHDVVSCLCYVLQGIRDGGGTRGDCQAGHAALEGCHAVLQHALRGVGQTSVDVAGVAQSEAVGGVLRVVEHVRRGLIDGHGACVCCGVGLFLTYVELEGLKAVVLLCAHSLFLSFII